MFFLSLFLAVAAIVAGCCFAYKLSNSPIKIEFHQNPLWWISSIMIMFAFLAFIIFAEYIVNIAVQSFGGASSTLWIKILTRFIDAGALIPILTILFSAFFEKVVEMNNLDYSEFYNEKYSKVIFSVIVLLNCVVYVKIIWEDLFVPGAFSEDVISVLNRVMLWVLTVVGSWFSIGFHCEGRIEKEIREIEKVYLFEDKKAKFKYCVSVIAPIIVLAILYLGPIFDLRSIIIFEVNFLALFLAISISMIFYLLVVGIHRRPSEKRSKSKLRKAVKAYLEGKKKDTYFLSVRYRIEENGIHVYKREVSYKDHEEEIDDVFGERDINIDIYDIEVIEKELFDLNEKQTEFMNKGFRKCKELAISELKERKRQKTKGKASASEN